MLIKDRKRGFKVRYMKGYYHGYRRGYKAGWANGHKEGYEKGYNNGLLEECYVEEVQVGEGIPF